MTCKDCIHYEICLLRKDFDTYNITPDGWDGNTCKQFKHSTTVPFMIGQPMWKLCIWHNSPAEILDSRVSMIQQKADKSWKIRISNRFGTEDFKAGDIGKYIFLTKESAEEALVEFNKNRGNL